MNYEKYQIYSNNNNFYKVIGIYTEYEPLLTVIQENIRYVIKQSEAAGLFDQESYSFNQFLAFKYVLLKTTYNNDIAKREMIEICRNYYRNNKKELLNIDEFERTYQSKDAFYWYIKQSFVYRLVNKALRTEDYAVILVLRFFILDLSKNLREKYQDLKQHSKTIVSYRGLKLTPPEIYNLKHNINATIATNGFLSTSRSKDIAYRFAKKTGKHPNLETVMLEINVNLSKVTASLADVIQYSDYSGEQEILFDLGASFTIKSVDYDSVQGMWFVKLEAQSEESMIDDIQTVLKAYRSESDMNILLGKLLFKIERYAVSRKYFESLLNFYGNDEYESLAKVYEFIGDTYSCLNDYDKAIFNYSTKALEYYTLLNRFEDVARVTNMIGIQYFLKNDKDNARLYYQKSHEVWKQLPAYTSENPPCDSGRLMFSFGYLEDNNQIACDYFFKALKIYQNPSETCEHTDHDFWIATQYESLADRYYNGNDYDKAFKYIMKSIPIRRKHVSTARMRSDYFFCLSTLREICKKTHEDVWLQYENEFSQLIDVDNLQLYPQSKDLIDSIKTVRRLKFLNENANNNTSTDFLEHSLKSLKYLLKTDPNNYQKIIQAYIDIGLAYTKVNDYYWSSQNYQTALEMCQIYLPNESEHMSTIYQHLSEISLKRNDIDQAFNFRVESLIVNKETCHLSTKENEAQCYFNIALVLSDTHVDKNLEFYIKSLEIRQEILPEDNINIAFCHGNIGYFYKKKCMFDAAIEHWKKAIGIYEKNFSHPYAKTLQLVSYSNIAAIYSCQNKYDDAFAFRMKILNFDEKYFHLTEQEKEAQCYFDIGEDLIERDVEKALEFYRRALKIREDILQPDHVNIGVCHQNIGTAYEKKSMFDMALEHYIKATEIYEKHLFDREEYQFNVKQFYGDCHNNMARCHSNMKKCEYINLINHTLKALQIYEEYCPENKTTIAQCYWNYGYILTKKGQYDEAIVQTQKSLHILLNENAIDIGRSYHPLGYCYEKKCEYEQALSFYEIALKNYEQYLINLNDENAAYVLGDIAACLLKLKQYDQALEYAIKSMQILEQIVPVIHVCKAVSHSLLALIYSKLSQNDKCNEHRIKALEIAKQWILNDEDIEYLAVVFENIGELYIIQNDFQMAEKYFKKTLKFIKEEKMNDHPDILRIQKIIDELSNNPRIGQLDHLNDDIMTFL